jgi:predicted DNA-binding protein with PD1-like motif
VTLSQIIHPGPVEAARYTALPCTATPIDVTLRTGIPFMDAVAQACKQKGCTSAWLSLQNAPMAAFKYLIPGEDPTGAHAAWYSGPHDAAGAIIQSLGLHLGTRGGAPFLHGHGIWDVPGKGPRTGHILPFDSVLKLEVVAQGWQINGATLDVQQSAETGFALFRPTYTSPQSAPNALLITLRPNGDFVSTLAEIASKHGITNAQIFGLGSLISPQFSDGSSVQSFATEILLTKGVLRDGQIHVETLVVGLDAKHKFGTLKQGACATCVTCEILMVATPNGAVG